MFYLYHHNDLDRLAELLAVLLARRQRTHALESDIVVVPNGGVERWLQMRLAESEGVAANLEFPLLARFIWEQIPGVLPGKPSSAEFERSRLRWHVYSVLPAVAERDASVASYLAAEPGDVHRLQLADRLTDVFDQYLVYRPNLLADWEAGRCAETTPDVWQARVWLALTERLGVEHRARLLSRFIEALTTDAAVNDTCLPEAIYCFGLGQLPPEYVKFLYALGRHTDVHFLLPNPCEGYWGDIRRSRVRIAEPVEAELDRDEQSIASGHPLLASMGRGTRDLLRVLYADELTAIQEPELGDAFAYETPVGDGLLQRVQADIIAMAARREERGMGPDDASIQVHACHGPLREVQVLQDQLLDILGRFPDIAPRDIAVMTPDVSAYAPLVRSVFGGARGRRYLPYSISDQTRSASHPIIQSFQRLIDLPLSRWAASEVLALAAVPAIGRRFGLDGPSLETAQRWLAGAGVRWGYDAGTRERFGAGRYEQNTWRFGLDRLLLGFAQADEETVTAGVAPWSDLEGGAVDTLGRVWLFVERLRAWQEALATPAGAGSWHDRLNRMIEDLFDTQDEGEDEAAALDEIRDAVAVLGDAARCLNGEPLSWETVREVLGVELSLPAGRQPYMSGGITFCGLVPLRAVPFKVICLLGMNDGDFPRQERNRAFNVLRAQPRIGDHSVRDDDRLMFLQALTSARSVFYVSYTGQDVGSGEELPPSPVVGEWMDFLHGHHFRGWSRQDFEARLITRQPMHPFSDRYFRVEPEHPRLFTFSHEWQPSSRAGGRERIAPPAFADGGRADASQENVIELSELRRFFDNPAKHFLLHRLRVDFESLEETAPDSEPLQLDSLTKYGLRSDLLARAQSEGSQWVETAPDDLWRARGVLPPPPLDSEPFREQADAVNALLPIWSSWTEAGATADRLDIDVQVAGRRLVGRLSSVWPDGPRLLRPGSLRMQYKLRAWIDYLAYLASGHEGVLRLAGLDGEAAIEQVGRIDAETARDHLTELLDVFAAGQREPLLFTPDLAEQYLYETLEKGRSPEAALEVLNRRLTNPFQPSFVAQDPYISILFLPGAPLGRTSSDTRFCELARLACGPPFERMERRIQP